ncbi:hypothetical protein FQR65_LT03969 [Abscondita terminalis]|nr:hypothetical protein FQR65_LT03969 [Abscondita terminalis]
MSYFHVPYDTTLDDYRKLSSFDSDELKKFMFSEESIKLQNELKEEIKKIEVLYGTDETYMTVEEQKRLAIKRAYAAHTIKLKLKDKVSSPYFSMAWIKTVDQIDKCVAVQNGILHSMFPNSLLILGTEQHLPLYNDVLNMKISGCFCLTEIGHGSDTKRMQTLATYDEDTKEFIIHTPNFQAGKCWIANLGKLATHAIVYAQLITPDKKRHGLHGFVVPIRDPKTLIPFPGVIVADIGEKIGLLGIDNGFIMFSHYRIPKMSLLNKLGDVTDDGKYVLKVENIKEQYANNFRVLLYGRLGIIIGACMFQLHALTIALRYAAIRRQFGPDNAKEWPVLEYQSHQYRLLPYLASSYTTLLFLNCIVINKNAFHSEDSEMITELHAILSTGKPYFSFIARNAIQECREACAGLGYLSASGLGKIRSNNDANLTFEGDNNVLMQQTSNWLLRFWPMVLTKKIINTPLESLSFLNNALDILQLKFEVVPIKEFYGHKNMSKYYQWLVCYLLKRSYEKCKHLDTASDADKFWIKNNNQIFNLKNLSIAYFEHFVLREIQSLVEVSPSESIRNVLNKLISLFSVWCLQNHVAFFYEGLFTDNPLFAQLIEESILLLCKELKNEAVSLVDVIAPFDDLMDSILGHSDGQMYDKLLRSLLQVPEGFSNANWLPNVPSKL